MIFMLSSVKAFLALPLDEIDAAAQKNALNLIGTELEGAA